MSSDNDSSDDPDMDWEVQKSKRKRHKDTYTIEEISQIIDVTSQVDQQLHEKDPKKQRTKNTPQEENAAAHSSKNSTNKFI